MTGLLDASVICTLLFDDEGAADIATWINASLPSPTLSSFAWGETVGAMGVKVRSGAIRADIASRLLTAFAADVTRWNRIDATAADIIAATTFIADLARPLRFADAIHIAVAQRLDETLISNDRQQLSAARSLGVRAINPLEP